MASGGYKGASPARETSPEQYPGVWELTEQFQAQADGNWPFQADDCAPKSLRFNGSSAYLGNTLGTKTTTFTLSFWVKRSKLGTWQYPWSQYDGSGYSGIGFSDDNRISLYNGGHSYTTAYFRDTSAWYHLCLKVSSGSGTLYVNNQEVATQTGLFLGGGLSKIGDFYSGSHPFDGYIAEFNAVADQALDPDAFTFIDGQGILQPKRFTGDYSSGPVYSNFLTGGIDPNYPAPNGFDGVTSGVGVRTSANGTMVWQPSSPIGFNSSFKIYCALDGNSYGNTFTVTHAGGTTDFTSSVVTTTTNTAVDLAQISGVTSPITNITVVSGGSNPRFSAIEVDGTFLIDAAVGRNSFRLDFGKDAGTVTTDQAGGSFYTGSSNHLLDGNLNTQVMGGYNTSTTDSDLTWTPPVGKYIVGNTSGDLQVYAGYFTSITVNGTSAATGTGNQVVGWVTLTHTGAITSIKLENTNGTGNVVRANVFKVNGLLINEGLSTDKSGLGNDWSVNNLGFADVFVDSPVNGNEASTGAGGERRGNYCSFNPLDKHGSITLSQGNLKVQASTAQWELARSTFFLSSGKHYWEFTWTGNVTSNSGYQMGLKTPESTLSAAAQQAGSYAFQYTSIYQTAGSLNTVTVSPGSTTSGDTVMFAYDADAGEMWIGVNGTWNGSGNPSTGANPDWTNLPKTGLSPFAGCYGATNTITLNAGQRAFKYTNHSGFSPLATSFLPEPSEVAKVPSKAFDTLLWDGQGVAADRTVSGLDMASGPDMVWSKTVNHNYHNNIFDVVRGFSGGGAALTTDYTASQANAGQIKSTNSTSITWEKDSTNGYVWYNESGKSYLSWCWDAGETTTTIAAGGLNSSVYDQSQQWSAGMKTSVAQTTNYITTGRTTSFPSSFTGQEPFNADLTDFLYGQTGVSGTWIYLEFATALTNVTSISFSTEYSCPNGVIKLNGTDVAVDKSNLGGGFVEVNVTGTIPSNLTEIAIQGHSGSSRLKWVKINGKYLIDGNPGVGKTLTRFRAKTDWNWHRIAAVKVNGTTLTTGTLDNSGSVWTNPDEWKDGNANSSNATYSQSARGDWFDVTLASSIANFSELQFYMQLDSSAGTTTNIYEIELFFSDGTSFLRTYAANSDAPNQAGAAFNSWQWQNFGDLGTAVSNLPSIATTVRARPDAGFSIAKYQGDGSTSGPSIAHNLGTKPAFVIIKNLDGSQSYPDYYVKHKDIGDNYNIRLNLYTGRELATGSGSWYQGGIGNLDDANVISFLTGSQTSTDNVNKNGVNYIAYCWAERENYSKMSSYVGSGNQQLVYLGFMPAWLMIKRYTDNTVGEWTIYDTARAPFNEVQKKLWANNASTQEDHPNNSIDIVSNGFVVDPGSDAPNVQYTNNGNVGYLYVAFAQNPFASNNRAR